MTTRICSWCGHEVQAREYCPTCTQQFVNGELPNPADMTPQERYDEVMLRQRLEIDVNLLKRRMSGLLNGEFFTRHWAIKPERLAQIARDAYPVKAGE